VASHSKPGSVVQRCAAIVTPLVDVHPFCERCAHCGRITGDHRIN
jgi:hypothetical protein